MLKCQTGIEENSANKSAAENPNDKRWDAHLPALHFPGEASKILILTPHADDETIAVGGIIAAARQAGSIIKVILVTDGNFFGLKSLRNQEFIKAMAKLGIPQDHLFRWEYPDARLKNYRTQLYRNVAEEIAAFTPDILIYPHPQDKHPDHNTLAQVAEEVLNTLASPPLAYRYLIYFYPLFPPRLLSGTARFLSPPAKLQKESSLWVQHLLTPEEKACKKQALKEYRTQIANPFIFWLMYCFWNDNEILEQYKPI